MGCQRLEERDVADSSGVDILRRPEVYGNKVQTTITQSPDQAAMSLDKEELIAEAKRRGLPTSIFGKKG